MHVGGLYTSVLPVRQQALRGTSEAIASLQRLEKFLLLEEAKDHEQSKASRQLGIEEAVHVHVTEGMQDLQDDKGRMAHLARTCDAPSTVCRDVWLTYILAYLPVARHWRSCNPNKNLHQPEALLVSALTPCHSYVIDALTCCVGTCRRSVPSSQMPSWCMPTTRTTSSCAFPSSRSRRERCALLWDVSAVVSCLYLQGCAIHGVHPGLWQEAAAGSC
jgi:hypothetical protein